MIGGEQAVRLRERFEGGEQFRVDRPVRGSRGFHRAGAFDQCAHPVDIRFDPKARGEDRTEHVDTMVGGHGLPDDVHAERDQGLLEFVQGGADARHMVLEIAVPGRLRHVQFERCSLGLDQVGEFGTFVVSGGLGRTPALDRLLQVGQPAVQSCVRDRRGHVADQRGTRTTFGDRPFRWIVRGIQVEIGQFADQPLGPAGVRHAALLARHELEGTVRAEVQYRVRLEVFLQVTVEGGERVRRGEALLEKQAHRVAFVSERRLDAHEDVAEAGTQDEQGAAVGLLSSGGGAPVRLDLAQPTLAADVVVGRDARMYVGIRAVAAGIPDEDALAQGLFVRRGFDVITGTLQ